MSDKKEDEEHPKITLTPDGPQIVIPPEVQAQMDADPELAKAMQDMFAEMKNAIQGVADGRYKSFEEAMEAFTGQRPQQIIPRYTPTYGYYLTTGPSKTHPGKLVAILSDGSPQEGHAEPVILTAEVVDDVEAARAWGERMKLEEPWMDEADDPEEEEEEEEEEGDDEFDLDDPEGEDEIQN